MLGNDAIQLVEERLAALGEEMRNWDSIARSTDFG